MADIIAIKPREKIQIDVEKQDETKTNILYLMMVLIGVHLANMVDDTTEASVAKVEKLKAQYDQNKKRVEGLLTELKRLKSEMETLKQDPDSLAELEKVKLDLENLQYKYHDQIMQGSKIQNEIVRTAKIEITPLHRVVEALESIAVRLLDVAIHQYGNEINFR